jgi:DNA-3-methyladenine glycosylase I
MKRCSWVSNNIEYIKYHDIEWGIPEHKDIKLFEILVLESMQAGLSWLTILLKRENYRESFDNFNYEKIALYDSNKISELLNNKGIIRNKLKINSIVNNAKAFINIQSEYGSFDEYIWKFANYKIINDKNKKVMAEKISKELKKGGFKFIGPKICYSFIESIGIFNNHNKNCFRYKQTEKLNNV